MILSTEKKGELEVCMVDSSNIRKTEYNENKKEFTVYFNKGGAYLYENTDVITYKKFILAQSQGKFFVEHIKNKPYKKIL